MPPQRLKSLQKNSFASRTLTSGLKPHSFEGTYRSAKALRRPKAGAKSSCNNE
jgi:hypothetical protein